MEQQSLGTRAIAAYGALGVAGILLSAVGRLWPLAAEPLRTGMSWGAWLAYGGSVIVMAWSEGYRAFQRAFSPRVVARAVGFAQRPVWWLVPVAPLVAMGLLFARRRRLLLAWSTTLGIVVLVVLVHGLRQPWRGAVDAGVVVGLLWGAVSIVVFWARTLRGVVPTIDPELPGTS